MKTLVWMLFVLSPVFCQDVLIRNATVITANEASARDVLIRQGVIEKVAPRIGVIEGVDTLDATGQFLIPGLIDAHVHIGEVHGFNPQQQTAHPDLVEAFNAQLPRSFLYWGFTTLIDFGGDMDRIREFENHQVRPDLFHAGSTLPVANGYPMHYVPDPQRFYAFDNFLWLESEKERIPEAIDPKAHSPKACVNRASERGARLIKTYFEPGFEGVKLPLPTPELFSDLVSQAKKVNLPIAVHMNSLQAYQFVSQYEVDLTAHGLWNWGPHFGQLSSLPQPVAEVLDALQARGTAYMATLQVIDGLRALADPHFFEDPELRRVVPQAILDWYQTEEGKWFVREFLDGRPAEKVYNIFSTIRKQGQASLAYVKKDRVLFGTDTPSSPTYGNPPGYNGYKEILQMEESGMSPKDIFLAMTVNNARVFKLAQHGHVAKGMVGNVLLLKSNPLESLDAYSQIDTVILHGKPIERKSLAAQ